jgi:hypothetical protein
VFPFGSARVGLSQDAVGEQAALAVFDPRARYFLLVVSLMVDAGTGCMVPASQAPAISSSALFVHCTMPAGDLKPQNSKKTAYLLCWGF